MGIVNQFTCHVYPIYDLLMLLEIHHNMLGGFSQKKTQTVDTQGF